MFHNIKSLPLHRVFHGIRFKVNEDWESGKIPFFYVYFLCLFLDKRTEEHIELKSKSGSNHKKKTEESPLPFFIIHSSLFTLHSSFLILHSSFFIIFHSSLFNALTSTSGMITSASLSFTRNPMYSGMVSISPSRPTLYCPNLIAFLT